MSSPVKLSSPATKEFWEIPVLFEDEHLLALDKPAVLSTTPEGDDPTRPSLMKLLHAGIAEGKPWARDRGLTYLNNAHWHDAGTTGVLLLAKTKPVYVALADLFGIEKPVRKYLALIHGTPPHDSFEVDAKIAPHPLKAGMMRVDFEAGKQARTQFETVEKFSRNTLLRCLPATDRVHQIRVHLVHAGVRLAGDELYGGQPLWLSRIKRNFRLKEGRTERPLLSRPAVHAEELSLPHPITGAALTITAPWPKDLTVAIKYLRQHAVSGGASTFRSDDE